MLGEEFDKLPGKAASRVRIPFTKLAVGQRAKVRFIWDLDKRLVLWRHERVPRPGGGYMRVTCALNEEYRDLSGGVCALCKENRPRRPVSFFLVWNHDTSQIEVLSANHTSYSFLDALREVHASDGTITDRDWIIARKPDDARPNASKYIALPGAPTGFALPPDASVPSHEDVVAMLAPRELGG